jgi:hypothetical protein
VTKVVFPSSAFTIESALPALPSGKMQPVNSKQELGDALVLRARTTAWHTGLVDKTYSIRQIEGTAIAIGSLVAPDAE